MDTKTNTLMAREHGLSLGISESGALSFAYNSGSVYGVKLCHTLAPPEVSRGVWV
ncbi:MAG TPA: hypothetical protein VGM37_18665 [Armatimonadota bacterium]